MTAEAPAPPQPIVVFDADAEVVDRRITVRPLPMAEGLRRLEQRRKLADMVHHGTSEGEEQKRLREVQEADVVAAARRSQAEIRRHVDAYLKEHLEIIVAEVAQLVVARTTERVEAGIAAVQENVQIQLDRIAADVRRQVEGYMRGLGGGGEP